MSTDSDSTTFLKGDKVRLKKPRSKRPAMDFVVDGEHAAIPFGTVMTVTTKKSVTVADMDATPAPVIQKTFINRNDNIQQLFELVEGAD